MLMFKMPQYIVTLVADTCLTGTFRCSRLQQNVLPTEKKDKICSFQILAKYLDIASAIYFITSSQRIVPKINTNLQQMLKSLCSLSYFAIFSALLKRASSVFVWFSTSFRNVVVIGDARTIKCHLQMLGFQFQLREFLFLAHLS